MMSSLDQHLAGQGLQPAQRSLPATLSVSNALGLGGTAFIGAGIVRGERFGPTDLLLRVADWYRENYGSRNKIDWSPGAVAICLRGSLWRLNLPLIFGKAKMFMSRDLSDGETGNAIGRSVPRCNILHLIDGLTQTYASRLSDHELDVVWQAFVVGHAATQCLTELDGDHLFDQARGDYRLSVDSLLDGRTLSKARWDTAQCAEKIFKGLLRREGHTFPTSGSKGHDISHLGELVGKHLGLSLTTSSLLAIHCSPTVRYGDMNVDLNEAYTSHRELLSMLVAIHSKGLHLAR